MNLVGVPISKQDRLEQARRFGELRRDDQRPSNLVIVTLGVCCIK